MNLIKSRTGFTLIEVIVSLAIVGILLITILSFLGKNFSHVFSLGRRTEGLYEVQSKIEEAISSSYSNRNNNNNLTFEIEGKEIEVEGQLHEKVIKGSNRVIKAFVPNKISSK